jgi:methyl-accepting chemotaxis protein
MGNNIPEAVKIMEANKLIRSKIDALIDAEIERNAKDVQDDTHKFPRGYHSINDVISNLTGNADRVNNTSGQIASSSESLSQATTQQAASAIKEINSMVQKNAENAKRTSDLSSSSNETAHRGKVVVTDMIHAIDDISDSNSVIMKQINESNEKILDIVRVISEIGEKTKVINDIVFQTKLLQHAW